MVMDTLKKAIILSLLVLLFPLASTALEVEKIDKGSVIISELNNPAVFDFKIKNTGSADSFEIYSLLGVSMSPKGRFELPLGESKIEVMAYPGMDARRNLGFYMFEYEIKGQNSGIFKDKLTVKIVQLKDVIEVSDFSIFPNSTEAAITITNKENTNLKDLKIKLDSSFFSTTTQTVSLGPYNSTVVRIKLEKIKFARLLSGTYALTAQVDLEDASVILKSDINYIKQENMVDTSSSLGFIIRETKISKANTGNVPATARIEIKENVFSRLFTTYPIAPTKTERDGLSVKYIWEKATNPGDIFTISAKTNYTFPFVLVILIVLVVIVTKFLSQRALTIDKRVSLVKTKGGEFALKVKLHIKAKKYAEGIQIIDTYPSVTQLYQGYGSKPDNMDLPNRRLFWNISKLNAGEERIFSYVIYSKIRVVGSFELPPATAVFEKGDKTHEVISNKTFFVSVVTSTETE